MKTIFIHHKNLQVIQQQAVPCVIALGYFDGVHLGHQQVITAARKEADERGLPLAVMSFRPHPIDVLSKGKRVVPNLTTIDVKEQRLQQLGVDVFYLVDFTIPFARLLPNQFVEQYLRKLQVVHAVAGFDFTYGAKGAAKLPQIVSDSDSSITVTEVECISYKGEKISSSAIRDRLLAGAVSEIRYFLGNDYTTNVYWNGQTFHQTNNIMLPSPGTYKVLLESSMQQMSAYITLDETAQIHFVELQDELFESELVIHWLQNISNSTLFQAIL